jgi:starch-binding outer membrane protein, SusD/RagB family
MKNKFFASIAAILMLIASGCKLDYENINNPTDTQVLSTREGLITLSIGVKQYYSTSALEALVVTPGTTSRELKGVTTFTNILEIEAGGTALPTFNGNINSLWSRMLRTMSMAEDIIANAPTVLASDNATRSGVMAHAQLFKAMAIGGLATAFEQLPTQTSKDGKSTFVPRQQALLTAIQLLDDAANMVNATPPSAEFTTRVLGSDFSLINVINAYRARYNMMAGRYTEALAAANTVNLTSKSQFIYSSQNPNPVYQQVWISANYRPRDNFGLPEAGDGRLSFYLSTPNFTVGGETLKTLRGFWDDIAKPIPVYLPDEMRLIKAEAIVRSGGTLTNALTEINAVRTQSSGDPFGVHANLPVYSGPVTANDLLLEIYKQRSAELFLQGLRLEDSRRFNRPAPPVGVNPVPLTFERNRNFYPYPDQERLTNPNTPQDPAI